MLDILMDTEGDYVDDLSLTEDGDIKVGGSVLQNIKIVIRWILGEWRLGPDLGFPWYEDVWVKNPSLALIRQAIINAVMDIDEVTSVDVDILEYDRNERTIKIHFDCTTDDDSYSGEVLVGG